MNYRVRWYNFYFLGVDSLVKDVCTYVLSSEIRYGVEVMLIRFR